MNAKDATPRDRGNVVTQRRAVAREVGCSKKRWFRKRAEVERAVRGRKDAYIHNNVRNA